MGACAYGAAWVARLAAVASESRPGSLWARQDTGVLVCLESCLLGLEGSTGGTVIFCSFAASLTGWMAEDADIELRLLS